MDAAAKNAQKQEYLKSIIALVGTTSEEAEDFLTKFDESLEEIKNKTKNEELSKNDGAHSVLAMKTAKKIIEKYYKEGVGEIKQWAVDHVQENLTEALESLGEEFGEEGLEGIADICEELGSEFGADALGEGGGAAPSPPTLALRPSL